MMDITELPPHDFFVACADWKADMKKNGVWDKIQEDIVKHARSCPVHNYAQARGLCKRTIRGTAKCPVCGSYMCPNCMSHAVRVGIVDADTYPEGETIASVAEKIEAVKAAKTWIQEQAINAGLV